MILSRMIALNHLTVFNMFDQESDYSDTNCREMGTCANNVQIVLVFAFLQVENPHLVMSYSSSCTPFHASLLPIIALSSTKFNSE